MWRLYTVTRYSFFYVIGPIFSSRKWCPFGCVVWHNIVILCCFYVVDLRYSSRKWCPVGCVVWHNSYIVFYVVDLRSFSRKWCPVGCVVWHNSYIVFYVVDLRSSSRKWCPVGCVVWPCTSVWVLYFHWCDTRDGDLTTLSIPICDDRHNLTADKTYRYGKSVSPCEYTSKKTSSSPLVTLVLEGRIGHFAKWQIRPSNTEMTTFSTNLFIRLWHILIA